MGKSHSVLLISCYSGLLPCSDGAQVEAGLFWIPVSLIIMIMMLIETNSVVSVGSFIQG
jgi:hypothetical protein